MGHFSRSLTHLRESSGFKTAYAFYHSNGGRKVFPFTYAYYAKIERGESLPRPPWLAKILRLVRVSSPADRARVVSDYLRDISVEKESFDLLFAPFLTVENEPAERRAIRSLRARTARHLTPREVRLTSSSLTAADCYVVLINTQGPLDVERIAEITKQPVDQCASALKELARQKLIRAHSGKRYSGLSTGANHTLPKDPTSQALVNGILAQMRERGNIRYQGVDALRLDPAALEAVIAKLKEAFDLAGGLAQWHADDKAGAPIYVLEARALCIIG